MRPRLPPFKSIEAFAEAARVQSLTKAAGALNLTVPAISRRIQALEIELGVPLFHRKSRSIELTEAGRDFFFELIPAIETLQTASERVRERSGRTTVKALMPASFAANWLVPRLHRFRSNHDNISVELESTTGDGDFDGVGADLAIWFGTGNWSGVRAKRLLDVEATPVCSANFLAANTGLKGSGDLPNVPLLGIKNQQDLWAEWLRTIGVKPPDNLSHAFDNFHLLYRAAASGLGVALGIDALVKPYLEDGQLVMPFDSWQRLKKGYYVVCRDADWTRRPVRVLREWLMAEASISKTATNR
jgi:LysR family glycine cleavage system transcriptional activator